MTVNHHYHHHRSLGYTCITQMVLRGRSRLLKMGVAVSLITGNGKPSSKAEADYWNSHFSSEASYGMFCFVFWHRVWASVPESTWSYTRQHPSRSKSRKIPQEQTVHKHEYMNMNMNEYEW